MKFLADDAGCINILFCEIYNLDINNKDNLEILDIIYSDFDRISRKFGIQKIETVGQMYMACSGLQLFEKNIDKELQNINSYDRLFNFAVELHKYIDRFSQQLPLLKIKIGMHSGNCIYGFFGQHKPQFSLIGDSVNTASRHCKVSQPGLIVLSKNFYAGFSNAKGIIFKVFGSFC
jgi:class 3 adenylate cyclase